MDDSRKIAWQNIQAQVIKKQESEYFEYLFRFTFDWNNDTIATINNPIFQTQAIRMPTYSEMVLTKVRSVYIRKTNTTGLYVEVGHRVIIQAPSSADIASVPGWNAVISPTSGYGAGVKTPFLSFAANSPTVMDVYEKIIPSSDLVMVVANNGNQSFAVLDSLQYQCDMIFKVR